MTNELDLEMARLNATVAIINITSEYADTCELGRSAAAFLVRQFAPPPEKLAFVKRDAVPQAPRCTQVVPGRTLRHEDAIYCSRQAGHEGPCDFHNMFSQPQ